MAAATPRYALVVTTASSLLGAAGTGAAGGGNREVAAIPARTIPNPSEVHRAKPTPGGRSLPRGGPRPGVARNPIADASGPKERVIDWLAQFANAVASGPRIEQRENERQVPADLAPLLEQEQAASTIGTERHQQHPRLEVRSGVESQVWRRMWIVTAAHSMPLTISASVPASSERDRPS